MAEIALDPNTKQLVAQIISQVIGDIKPRKKGILKAASIRGALLYGPPGTGKTHLGRVLANECKEKARVLAVTSAEVSIKWVGDTEKFIKALFSLGNIFAPSIIFIDEADSLLRSRNLDAQSWIHSQVNQFLTEMDGLVKRQNAPFVILSTNFPQNMDHAVLRRTPLKLHLGLPSTDIRRSIIEILLKDDTIGSDTDTMSLAKMTSGYSGSDLRNLCIQAAVLAKSDAENDIRASGEESDMVLGKKHFVQAMKLVKPSTSEEILENIRQFSQAYNPSALAEWTSEAQNTTQTGKQYTLDRAWKATLKDRSIHLRAKQVSFSNKMMLPESIAGKRVISFQPGLCTTCREIGFFSDFPSSPEWAVLPTHPTPMQIDETGNSPLMSHVLYNF